MRIVVLCVLLGFLAGCANPEVAQRRCKKLSALGTEIARTITDTATTDEDKIAEVARYTRIVELAADFGCPEIFPVVEPEVE